MRFPAIHPRFLER